MKMQTSAWCIREIYQNENLGVVHCSAALRECTLRDPKIAHFEGYFWAP
jgi:hypothetical protein